VSRRGPLRRAWKRCRERWLDRLGLLYGRRFFAKSLRKKGDSDRLVAASLRRHCACRTVVDIGCGDGYFLAALQAEGCRVFGLERSAAGLAGCAARGVAAARFDIRSDQLPARAHGELCLCFEVAEHLPAESAGRLVELVTQAAPRAVFTAATPGQGGVGHVNEQPHDYWCGCSKRPAGGRTSCWRRSSATSGGRRAWYPGCRTI